MSSGNEERPAASLQVCVRACESVCHSPSCHGNSGHLGKRPHRGDSSNELSPTSDATACQSHDGPVSVRLCVCVWGGEIHLNSGVVKGNVSSVCLRCLRRREGSKFAARSINTLDFPNGQTFVDEQRRMCTASKCVCVGGDLSLFCFGGEIERLRVFGQVKTETFSCTLDHRNACTSFLSFRGRQKKKHGKQTRSQFRD